MANNLNPNPNTYPGTNATNAKTLLLPEIGADGLARENPVIAYTERIIEKEQLELKKYIEENYSKIRDVERELTNLTMEAKLTSGPKKAALEHMRKKIELSTEKIRIAKLKEEEARKAWEAASQIVKDEESTKQKLCDDLNNLVMESSNAQYARLDELKKRLEALNPTRSSILPSSDTTPAQISTTQVESLVPIALEAINKSNIAETQLANNITSDTEGRAKKKNVMQGRGKGINAVPKSRGNQGPGWTGAGFDVDGRS